MSQSLYLNNDWFTTISGENYKTAGYVITDETMELLKEHMKATGGNVCIFSMK